ncbi:hypothetical protein GCM10022197_10480 [Microlunatus spumicola]|uniref:Uncharacterized protein n=1 Tax=Microlunatus spumicola TaxID=81499 RepID=A0ABP6WVU1_9ACTN
MGARDDVDRVDLELAETVGQPDHVAHPDRAGQRRPPEPLRGQRDPSGLGRAQTFGWHLGNASGLP